MHRARRVVEASMGRGGKYIAAIDQGTTSSRCMLFDRTGRIIASAQAEHDQHYPQPGYVEHDAKQIMQRVREVVAEAMNKASATRDDVAALGITNQRETTVIWDRRTGEPYCNAIVWQDTRTKRLCDRLDAHDGRERIREVTGLPVATYFSGPKMRWALDHVEGLRDAASRGEALAGTIDAWLVWSLTGGPDGGRHVTDVTNASRTMMMDLHALAWDEVSVEVIGVPASMLPQIVPTSHAEAYGVVAGDGPLAGVPIAAAIGDQQGALVGQCCFDVGDAKNTYGTGCFMLMNTGAEIVRSQHGLLTTVGYQLPDRRPVYALEGSIAITGALVQWLRDNLGLIESSSEIEAMAAAVEDAAGIYFVPAFSGLFAPHWRSDARGCIVGLTRAVNKHHLARAVLEATAYQTREVIEAMRHDAKSPLNVLKVDGGMVVNELLMQFQADILGVEVVRPVVSETTALGAAYMAGVAVGFWDGLEAVRENWQADKTWRPTFDAARRDAMYDGWLKAVQRSLDWVH